MTERPDSCPTCGSSQQSPTPLLPYNHIPGLTPKEDGYMDELFHGLVTQKNLAFVYEMAKMWGRKKPDVKPIVNRIVAHLALKHDEYVGQYWEELVEVAEAASHPAPKEGE